MIKRRTFLRGLGAGLTLPLLPSLSPLAFAQQGKSPYDRVLFIVWSHGVFHPLWLPTFSDSVQARRIGPGVTTRPMSEASFAMYMGGHFEKLRSKIAILRGVSQIGAWGHSPSVALAASERINDEKIDAVFPDSVDNVIANADAFYAAKPDLPVLRLSTNSLKFSHSYRDGRALECLSAEAAFAKLFPDGAPAPSTGSDQGPSEAELDARRDRIAVERTLRRYRALLQGDRIAAAERPILERTVGHYEELAANLRRRVEDSGEALMSEACQPFQVSGSDDIEKKVDDQIKLIVQGFACGVTRVGYWRLRSTHQDGVGAHNADSSSNREGSGRYSVYMKENMKWVARLLTEMDETPEANGKTMLDNSLVVVTSDMATSVIGSHPGLDAPYLLAGGLGGKIRTGEYIDYFDYSEAGDLTKINKKLGGVSERKKVAMRGGPPHNELMISIMTALGLTPKDWERGGRRGFGSYACDNDKLCRSQEYEPQGAYVRYYHEKYKGSRPEGRELDYLRVGS